MFRSKAYIILIHIACWLLFWSLPVIFSPGILSGNGFFSFLLSSSYWLFCGTYLLVFYLTSYVLIPWLYLRKKYVYYVLSVILLFILVFLLRPFDRFSTETRRFQMHRITRPVTDSLPELQPLPMRASRIVVFSGNKMLFLSKDHFFLRIDLISTYLFFTVIALSMAIEISRRWRLSEQRAVRAEADKANAELSFLKAQINPHFMYNTLNNLYSLAVTKSELTAAGIIRLSNIMRYITDDAGNDFVPLHDEIAFIRDYIDLQRLRLGKNVPLTFEVSGDTENKTIAPLILITFIENAFKFGISKHHTSPVAIKIHAEEKKLSFFSENRIFNMNPKMERTSIGVNNTKQRLEYLYPGKHVLTISTANNIYTVMLILQL